MPKLSKLHRVYSENIKSIFDKFCGSVLILCICVNASNTNKKVTFYIKCRKDCFAHFIKDKSSCHDRIYQAGTYTQILVTRKWKNYRTLEKKWKLLALSLEQLNGIVGRLVCGVGENLSHKIDHYYCDPIWQVIDRVVFPMMEGGKQSCWVLLIFSSVCRASYILL